MKVRDKILLSLVLIIIYNVGKFHGYESSNSAAQTSSMFDPQDVQSQDGLKQQVARPDIDILLPPSDRSPPSLPLPLPLPPPEKGTEPETKLGSAKAPQNTNKNKCNQRKFVKYTSSKWEQIWLDNIERWQDEKYICDALFDQLEYLNKFMYSTCSYFPEGSTWCMKDDSLNQLWWNSENGRTLTYPPPGLSPGPLTPVRPTDEEIFSRYDFVNECKNDEPFFELIEPLVSHLRHPVSGCGTKFCSPKDACKPNEGGGKYFTDRSWIVPPPTKPTAEKSYYFDAGASSWTAGQGGPSLSYFAAVWKRHGIDFDHIEAWEGGTSTQKFYGTVPAEYKDRTHYQQQLISSQPTSEGGNPFVPTVIKSMAKKEDYVLFKLDIDSGPVEQGTVDFLLDPANDEIEYIDEFLWEHHVDNYIMHGHWEGGIDWSLKISDSYMYFLKMRQKGVRAHSWI